MDEAAETHWRKALQARGKDWVMAELRRRAGRPDDPVYDIVFEEPLPTRQFCQDWCAEEDNKLFHISLHTYILIAAFLITMFCCVVAVRSFTSIETPPPASLPPPVPKAAPLGSPGLTANGGSTSGAPSFSNSSPSSTSVPSVCAYQSYTTDECKQQ